MRIFDLSETEPPARDWKQHLDLAERVAGSTDNNGAVFTVIQASKKGFWVSEWSATRSPVGVKIARRRAALERTKEKAIATASVELSLHSSHYFRPEEGWLGRWKRL